MPEKPGILRFLYEGYYLDSASAEIVDVSGNAIGKTYSVNGQSRTLWSWTVNGAGSSGTLVINEATAERYVSYRYYGIKLTAKPYQYNVVYDTAGGTPAVTDSNTYLYTDTFIVPGTIPTKEGYVFTGWKVGNSSTILAPGESMALNQAPYTGTGATRTVTLTAQWLDEEQAEDTKIYYTIKVSLKQHDGTVTDVIIESAYEGMPLYIFEEALRAKVEADTGLDMSEYDLGESVNLYIDSVTSGQEFGVEFDERHYDIVVESASEEALYDGAEHTASGFHTHVTIHGEQYAVTDQGDNHLSFEYKNNTYTISGLTTANPTETDAGTYPNTISVGTVQVVNSHGTDVTEQCAVSTQNGNLKINKRVVTLTSATDSKSYDGEPLTNDEVTVGGDGFISGEGATYDVTGSQTLVGSSSNTFSYTLNAGTKEGNYTISKNEGTLTVTDVDVPDDLVVTKTADEGPYDFGEEVTFNITAKNIYAEAKTITLSEIEGVTLEESTFANVAPGAEIQTTEMNTR